MYVCACVGMHVCSYVCSVPSEGKGVLDLLNQELQPVVKHLTWTLGTELSEAIYALNNPVSSPASLPHIFCNQFDNEHHTSKHPGIF